MKLKALTTFIGAVVAGVAALVLEEQGSQERPRPESGPVIEAV